MILVVSHIIFIMTIQDSTILGLFLISVKLVTFRNNILLYTNLNLKNFITLVVFSPTIIGSLI